MYRIYSIHPGMVFGKFEHGEVVEVSVGIDKKYHCSVKVRVEHLDKGRLESDGETLRGFYNPQDGAMTFSFTSSFHWSFETDTMGMNIPHPEIVIGVLRDDEPLLFEGITKRLLYHSDGQE